MQTFLANHALQRLLELSVVSENYNKGQIDQSQERYTYIVDVLGSNEFHDRLKV